MNTPRISASSYSNTAPLVWSFLYGKDRGTAELILDTAPARSAELLMQDRVDAALVPVIAYQMIEGVRMVPDICVGARKRVRSVCLITNGQDLSDVRSVSLDVSSRTSVVLTKIIFREFLGFEPVWSNAVPDIGQMLAEADAALVIGDPALRLSAAGDTPLKVFDLAELWHQHTGLGFVFAMWMTRRENISIDLAAARDEGLRHIGDIAANYASDTGLSRDEMQRYLTENISYSIDDSMQQGLDLYFRLAARHRLIPRSAESRYI
ncbi:MAG TPA: menaquinone biosynthesis protein [Pyrinomonadaceae bacterium]|nr:menaquinone biosynthesis protein [Chloracidobacterium sp.]MBP9934358.1 menaquinone biosynthesis protein [Pyrinomonadaceae bacterium]MBL0241756.1 menaquinone biosynthesis protein [Chloracidobacterium sp.]HQX56461.1 menaquinone biosynthesis protein [Pyrinomonadaceae bacterium]HQY65828.1 menaquinone biosynthesis protein [Pyrinomonadaceae bacterium]